MKQIFLKEKAKTHGSMSRQGGSVAMAGLILSFSLLLAAGCKNEDLAPSTPRTIRFELYTDQDFSKETNSIVFEPSISDGRTVLWDSVFTSMQLKDIPSEAHKIVFEKVIRNNNAELKVGFKYTLDNVGYSWFYDKSTPGVQLKTVTFNFK